MRILVTGATGLVGSRLLPALLGDGHEVLALSRRDSPGFPDRVLTLRGDPASPGPWLNELDRCDAVIHLAGENVFARRWRAKFKQRLIDSRVEPTRLIAARMAEHPRRDEGSPKVLISASAVGYYGPHEDEELVESDAPGGDFLAKICIVWEAAADPARAAGVRVVHPRIGMVLAPDGGALSKLLLPFKLFIGGPVGDGKQWISWIHIDDLTGMIRHALSSDSLHGPMNATAPEPQTNWGFSKTLAKVLKRPCWLPVPRFALRVLLGEVAAVATRGQRVIPQQAIQHGYRFQYDDLEQALRQLLNRPVASRPISG